MLRFWFEMVAFYRSLSPIMSTLKQKYSSPVFGVGYLARIQEQNRLQQVKSGNCMTFAVAQKRRHGGHVINIRSRYGWWFHSYWLSDDGNVYEFAPVESHRKVKKLWHPLPPLVYQGKQRVAPIVPPAALRKIHAIQNARTVGSLTPTGRIRAAVVQHASASGIDAAAA